LQLDDKDKGNRRFSIIKSESKLKQGKEVNKTVKDKQIVADYLAWLYTNFPEVIEYQKLEALDNKDKRELEERSQNESNNFWEWLEENYADMK
jgi:hypothetical protein